MKRFKQILCVLTSLILILAMLPIKPIQAEDEVIVIHTVEEFNDFVDYSRLDTWSQNKTVYLANDLDFSEQAYTPVPIFSGTFDGQGHTISGIQIKANEPKLGLFRILASNGCIKNLNVSLSIQEDEGKELFGGIAAENYGHIINCKFSGNIYGNAIVGGIAGINQNSGRIANCEVTGTLSAEKYTGGITGENFGSIIKCVNRCRINTSSKESTLDLENLNLEDIDALNVSTKPISSHTDTGGISGYSSGIIQSCINYGMVGYQHMGYNVGGIVGRQSGYLLGCSNYGHIFGRKDVGGIVGQMEPAFIQQVSKGNLQSINDELDKLQNMIDNAMNHVDNNTSVISKRITTLSEYTDEASKHSKNVLDQTLEFANTNIDILNDTNILIVDTLDQLDPIIRKLKVTSDSTSKALAQFQDATKDLSQISKDSALILRQINLSVQDLQTANKAMEKAADKIQTALKQISEAAANGDQDKIDEAMKQLSEGIQELSDAMSQSSDAVKMIADALNGKKDIHEAALSLSDSLSSMSSAVSKINEALRKILEEVDWTKVQDALKEAITAIDDMKDSSEAFDAAFKKLVTALNESEILNDDLQPLYRHMKKALGNMETAVDDFSVMIREIRKLIQDLAEKEPIQFTNLPAGYQQNTESLHASITGISSQMKLLNQEVESVSSILTADIRAISNQFNVIMHLMLDALSDQDSEQSIFEDTSDQDIQNTTNGKVAGSTNYDIVEGDVNIGGIAGSMAIEFDLDPEDDISSISDIMKYRYETKAVMTGCINEGKVISKKNNAGGMVGKMDLGTISECEGYGSVESTSGDYVGGIAGYSDAKIQQCVVKAEFKGYNYIGGIAGRAHDIIDSYSLIKVDQGIGRIGAIAGDQDKQGIINHNYFVDCGLAGIDGISYTGIAEPIDYQELKAMDSLPDEFFDFKLVFKIDNRTVKTVQFDYNDDLSSLVYPDIPEKEGYYANWPDFDTTKVQFSKILTAEYKPWISVLASEACDENKKPIALAQGNFTNDEHFIVNAYSDSKPSNVNGDYECWTLNLNIPFDDPVPVRLLKPVNGKISLWELTSDGTWESKSFTDNGSYILLDMDTPSATYCIAARKNYNLIMIVGIVTLLLISGYFIIKKHKSRRIS